MKIRALLGTAVNDAQYHWRVHVPFKYMKKYGMDVGVINIGEYIEPDVDILILPKFFAREEEKEDAQKLFKLIRGNNTTIVYDIDDDIWSESYVQYMVQMAGKTYNRNLLQVLIGEYEKRRLENLWTAMQCDAIIVSNQALAEYATRITGKPIFVVENAIDVEAFEASLNAGQPYWHPHYVTIGWAGGSRPQQDLTTMLEAWEIVSKMDQVKFVIAGWVPNLEQYPGIRSKLISMEWGSVNDYARYMQVDIGCVAIGDTKFAERKTPIKAWEFSLAGAMVVGSKALYGDEPIVACSTVEDWVKSLKFYIENDEARESFAEAYRKYVVGQYNAEFNWVYWADAYSKILNTVAKDERDPVSV